MSTQKITLYYAHDPMCSWCYGFRPVWQQVTDWCQDKVNIEYLLGGLAADTNEIMPQAMQTDIQSYWQKIEQAIPGTTFNVDFWTNNQPRRSTYRSCRAVIAARVQQTNKPLEMITAIQNAFYQQALNPSNRDTLIDCAKQCDLDISADLDAPHTQNLLKLEMQQCRQLGLTSFPSLLIEKNGEFYDLAVDYLSAKTIIRHIQLYL